MAFIGLGGVLIILVGLLSVLIPLRFMGIKSRGQGFVVAIAGFMIAGYAANNDSPKSQMPSSSEPIAAAAQSSPSAAPVPLKLSAAERATLSMPDAQRQFIAVVEKAQVAFNSAINDMQKGAARPARAKGICSTLSSLALGNWVGQVEELSSNNDGYGILSIKIAKGTYVKTWNNSFSDIVDNTLLDPSSAMFAKASALKEGQWVTFSGSFKRDEADCIREGSVTLEGSLTEPEFIIRFSDISPMNM